MSLLGFDALGRLALGQVTGRQNFTLSAAAGSFSVVGVAALFRVSEASAVGSIAVSGISGSFAVKQASAVGAFSFLGKTAAFSVRQVAVKGTFTINGQPANEPIVERADGGVFTVTGMPTGYTRTGDNYEFKLGGVGHFLEEIERQKQLNAITRKIPGPVDRRTVPRFEPLRGPPSAPAAPVPDVAAIQNQRTAAAAAQAEAAKKRRRDEEAVLLLAC